jgi:protein-S-isoprenylcysteine O-methyltransferase Ste14
MVNIEQLTISLLLPITVVVIIPLILLITIEKRQILTIFNKNIFLLSIGLVLIVLVLALFIECIASFYNIGKGTLMPISTLQTHKLIIKGPYKYVRNPMIVEVITILFGGVFIFNSLTILIFNLLFFIANLIYIPLLEEKGLIKRFGKDYLFCKKKLRDGFPALHHLNIKNNRIFNLNQ